MAKQKLIIRDFSGGMNTKRDPRDIADNESSYMNNFSIDAIGKLKTVMQYQLLVLVDFMTI